MRAQTGIIVRLVALLGVCAMLMGCGAISSLLGRSKTTALSSLRVAAPPGANINSATLLDLVFVYDNTSAGMLPKTGPEWFAQKAALQNGLGQAIDIVSLQVPPAIVIDPVPLPKRAGKAVAVYGFANYQSADGQARVDLTRFHHVVIWLAATQITVTEQ